MGWIDHDVDAMTRTEKKGRKGKGGEGNRTAGIEKRGKKIK